MVFVVNIALLLTISAADRKNSYFFVEVENISASQLLYVVLFVLRKSRVASFHTALFSSFTMRLFVGGK